MRRITSSRILVLLVAILMLWGLPFGCTETENSDPNVEEVLVIHTTQITEEIPQLDTLIAEYLEIDRLDETALDVGDANLFVGLDPADGSASRAFPECATAECEFLDWDDLCQRDLVNHLVADDYGGRDADSFPLKNECVGSSNVLAKMDLTYIASANNSTHAYFAVQRNNNNGDAGYYWLFTHTVPSCEQDLDVCKADQCRLLYDISGPGSNVSGDVLIAGQFHPGSGVVVRVYQAITDSPATPAGAAINYEDTSLWQEVVLDGIHGAVNLTATDPGACGAEGVSSKALIDGNMAEEIFAEASVPLSVFTGDSLCGAQFYGTVISRPSGAGGSSPDLKDLAGPAAFNFGELTAEGSLAPSCDHRQFSYQLDALTGPGVDGLENVNCDWTFTHKGDATTCDTASGPSFEIEGSCTDAAATLPDGLPEGRYCAEVDVSVSFGQASCDLATPIGEVDIYNALEATGSVSASCQHRTFGYQLDTASGQSANGPEDVSCDWTFTHKGGATDCADAAGPSFGVENSCSDMAAVLPDGLPEGDYCATVQVIAQTCNAPVDAGEVGIFNGLEGSASTAPTCEPRLFSYQLDDLSGQSVLGPEDALCHWTFTHLGDATDCTTATGPDYFVTSSCEDPAATLPAGLPTGTYCATVDATVDLPDRACDLTLSGGAVDVWDAIVINDPDAQGSCENAFSATAGVSGSSGDWDLLWTCTNDSGGPTLTSTSLTPTFTGLDAGHYSCVLEVTAKRTDITGTGAACYMISSEVGDNVATPLAVNLHPTAGERVCSPDTVFDDSVTYAAFATGGGAIPSYTFDWNVDFCADGPGLGSCLVDPGDNICPNIDLFVTLHDTSAAASYCTAATSETETYTKVIEVNATDR